MGEPGASSRVLTLVFTDLAGSTALKTGKEARDLRKEAVDALENILARPAGGS